MKYLFRSIILVVLLTAGTFFLLDSCKSTGKTSGMKSSGGFTDTSTVSKTDTGKGNAGGKDDPKKPL